MRIDELKQHLRAMPQNADYTKIDDAHIDIGNGIDTILSCHGVDRLILDDKNDLSATDNNNYYVHLDRPTFNILLQYAETDPEIRCKPKEDKYMVVLSELHDGSKICYAKDDSKDFDYTVCEFKPDQFYNKHKFLFTKDELNDLYTFINDNDASKNQLVAIAKLGTILIEDDNDEC